MTCITCTISQPIESGAEQLAKILNATISPHVLDIFQGFIVLWAIYTIVVKGIVQGDIKLSSTLQQLCIFAVIGLLLKRNFMLWDLIYNPLKQLTQALVQTILNAGFAGKYTSMHKGYIAAIDGVVQQMAEFGSNIKFSVWTPFETFGSLIIMCLYVFVGAISVAWVLEYIFMVFWISSFSPILLLCMAFPATRKNAYNAFSSLFGALFTVCFSIMSMSLTLLIYRKLYLGIAPSGDINGGVSFNYGADWIALVMLGIVSIYMQGKARNLASNITGVSDGSGMAMAISGAGTAVIGMAASAGVGKAVGALGAGAKAAKSGLSTAKKTWDAYKSKVSNDGGKE